MATDRDNGGSLEAAIRAWTRAAGITENRPVQVAVERAALAYRRGATVAEAVGVARGFVLCWQRHPANAAYRARIGA